MPGLFSEEEPVRGRRVPRGNSPLGTPCWKSEDCPTVLQVPNCPKREEERWRRWALFEAGA